MFWLACINTRKISIYPLFSHILLSFTSTQISLTVTSQRSSDDFSIPSKIQKDLFSFVGGKCDPTVKEI